MSKRWLVLLLLGVSIGRGAVAHASIAINPIDVGDVMVGQTGSAGGTLTSTENTTVELQLATGGDCLQFRITSPTSVTVGPGNSRTVTVEFTPATIGTKSCMITANPAPGGGATIMFPVTGNGTARQIVVDPVSFSFGHVEVGGDSVTPLTVTATNTGNLPLTISSATLTAPGTNFTVTRTPGSPTVPAGTSVEWDIKCSPRPPDAQGDLTGTFRIQSNSRTGATTDVRLTCVGDQGVVATDESAIDFGPVSLGGSRMVTFTLKNDGNLPIHQITGVLDKPGIGYVFNASTVPPTLAPAPVGTAILAVMFAPTAASDGGDAKITFTAKWGANDARTTTTIVTLAGQTVSLNLSETALDFGDFRFDSSPTQTFQIINNGRAPVQITGVTFASDDLGTNVGDVVLAIREGSVNVPSLPAPLGAGHRFDVVATAKPDNRTGLVKGHITVHSSTSGIPDQDVAITGNATAALVTAPMMVSFGAVDVDVHEQPSPTMTAAIANSGTATLDITSITKLAGGSDAFKITLPATPIHLEPGAAQPLAIGYVPTVERSTDETLVLEAVVRGVLGQPSDGLKVRITVSGRGIDRHLVVEPEVTFPPTFRNPGDMAPTQVIRVDNNGEALLRISAVMISGGPVWQLVDADPVDVAIPGGSFHNFTVKFSPTSLDSVGDGQLTLVNNDTNLSMKTVTLKGSAKPRLVAFGRDVIDFGFTGAGIPVTATLGVINMDQETPFKIHAIELSENAAFHIENAPSDTALPASNTKTFTLRFAPDSVGHFETTARLYLDQDAEQQAEVHITGDALFVDAHGSGGCSAGGTGSGAGAMFAFGVLGAIGAVVRRLRRAGRATAAIVATIAVASPAARAEGVDLAVFAPTPATTGTGFQLQSPEVGVDGSWSLGTTVSYARNPLVIEGFSQQNAPTIRDAPVTDSMLFQLGVAYAFLDRFEAGVRLPLYMQRGQSSAGTTSAVSPADGWATGKVALHLKAHLWRTGGLALGASALAVVPTATKGQYTGSDQPAARLLALGSFAPAALDSRLVISASAGPILRSKSIYANIVEQSGVAWGAGASFRVRDELWATGELFGEATPSGERQQIGTMTTVLSPIEWLAGVRLQPARQFSFGLALGRGVTDAIGTPDVRGVVSFAFVPGAPAIAPLHATRPSVPDGDSDGDGILDADDKCPGKPEDKDLFEDGDGCPDEDNDHDGIPDALDKCPLEPEDKDGFQDSDGCPDKDNDGDGSPDAFDKCPNEPEDKDGFEDADGCPDPDNDHDGIPDAADKCPSAPETINGIADDDGCPDKGDTAIVLSPDRIETLDPIQFTGLKLTKASIALITQVGATLRAHPEILRLRITVHVQPTSDSVADQTRSDRRAQAIRDWLVQWGIAPARLEARGFGGTKPLVAPDQRGAAKINDRIELIILERK